MKHNLRCGIHTGFPPCCIAFHTFIWAPIREYKNGSGLTFYLKEKSVKGLVSLALENAKELHRNINLRFHLGHYFGCPKCIITGHYVDLKSCSHIRNLNKHKEDDMSFIKAITEGYLESIWLDYDKDSWTEEWREHNEYLDSKLYTRSIKDVVADVIENTLFINFYSLRYIKLM